MTCQRCDRGLEPAEIVWCRVLVKTDSLIRGTALKLCVRCAAEMECQPDSQALPEIGRLLQKS